MYARCLLVYSPYSAFSLFHIFFFFSLLLFLALPFCVCLSPSPILFLSPSPFPFPLLALLLSLSPSPPSLSLSLPPLLAPPTHLPFFFLSYSPSPPHPPHPASRRARSSRETASVSERAPSRPRASYCCMNDVVKVNAPPLMRLVNTLTMAREAVAGGRPRTHREIW